VGKIDEKAVCRSDLNAELTKTHSFRLFFGDFSHWVGLKGEYYLRGEISQDINYRSFGGLKFMSANKFFRFFF